MCILGVAIVIIRRTGITFIGNLHAAYQLDFKH